MSEITPNTADYKRSTLLSKFYDRIAGTLAGTEPCVRIGQFRFGHGFVDESTSPRPTFQPIPGDLEAVPGEFFSGTPEMLKADGRVLVRCRLPKGSVTEPQKFSIIGLYDTEGNLLAVMQDLPDWITPDDSHTAYGYLDFPHLGENPPEVF
jgi:hypothetical protein